MSHKIVWKYVQLWPGEFFSKLVCKSIYIPCGERDVAVYSGFIYLGLALMPTMST